MYRNLIGTAYLLANGRRTVLMFCLPRTLAFRHQDFWREVLALVKDGLQYSQARLAEYRGAGPGAGERNGHGSSGGYAVVPDAKNVALPTNPDEDEDGDEDESLVE